MTVKRKNTKVKNKQKQKQKQKQTQNVVVNINQPKTAKRRKYNYSKQQVPKPQPNINLSMPLHHSFYLDRQQPQFLHAPSNTIQPLTAPSNTIQPLQSSESTHQSSVSGIESPYYIPNVPLHPTYSPTIDIKPYYRYDDEISLDSTIPENRLSLNSMNSSDNFSAPYPKNKIRETSFDNTTPPLNYMNSSEIFSAPYQNNQIPDIESKPKYKTGFKYEEDLKIPKPTKKREYLQENTSGLNQPNLNVSSSSLMIPENLNENTQEKTTVKNMVKRIEKNIENRKKGLEEQKKIKSTKKIELTKQKQNELNKYEKDLTKQFVNDLIKEKEIEAKTIKKLERDRINRERGLQRQQKMVEDKITRKQLKDAKQLIKNRENERKEFVETTKTELLKKGISRNVINNILGYTVHPDDLPKSQKQVSKMTKQESAENARNYKKGAKK